MGFKVEFNSILRTDNIPSKIEVGKEYSFEMEGSRIYFDDIPIWLLKKDWTAVAEIQIISQQRGGGVFKTGIFKVLYIYSSKESVELTKVFRRMYGW
jgi:hypothetical protein